MMKYTYGLTRKQCGVIFANIKNGNLTLEDDYSKWMYDHIADYNHYYNSAVQNVVDRMKSGLEAIFAGNMKEAEEELKSAYFVWHVNFK